MILSYTPLDFAHRSFKMLLALEGYHHAPERLSRTWPMNLFALSNTPLPMWKCGILPASRHRSRAGSCAWLSIRERSRSSLGLRGKRSPSRRYRRKPLASLNSPFPRFPFRQRRLWADGLLGPVESQHHDWPPALALRYPGYFLINFFLGRACVKDIDVLGGALDRLVQAVGAKPAPRAKLERLARQFIGKLRSKPDPDPLYIVLFDGHAQPESCIQGVAAKRGNGCSRNRDAPTRIPPPASPLAACGSPVLGATFYIPGNCSAPDRAGLRDVFE